MPLGVPERHPGDLLSVLGAVRVGAAHALRVGGAGRHALSNSSKVPGCRRRVVTQVKCSSMAFLRTGWACRPPLRPP